LGNFAREVWVALGLSSLVIGAVFIVGQTDYKRLLAYSSVEHMGILALGVGLGSAGAFGAMLHAVNHSLTKAMLFLVSGNILARYQTKTIAQVRGLLTVAPATGLLWLAGFLALTGTPPFGIFLSKFTILKAAFDSGHGCIGAVAIGLLVVIFVGMTTVFLGMAHGEPAKPQVAPPRELWWQILPPAALGLLVLWFGLAVPEPLTRVLEQIAATLGGAS
jgi:hydrogenase-4 component F